MQSNNESSKTGYIVSAFLCLAVFVMAVVKIGDYDVWYHIKAGEFIIKTGAINHLDPFSYTASSEHWSIQSWLAAVIFYAVHAATGVDGLIIFNAIVVTATFFIVRQTMALKADNSENIILPLFFIIAAFAARFRFPVRPHIFEFFFLASIIYIFNLYKYRGKNLLFIIPIIQVLWVNIHGSHILGLILPVIYMVGSLKPEANESNTRGSFIKTVAVILAINIIATFINPAAYKAFSLPFTITGQASYMQNIDEWQPLQLHHLWGYSLRYTWGFSTLVILGALSLIYKRKSLTDALLFIFFLAMAIKGIRLMAEFALVAAPIAYSGFTPVFSGVRRLKGRVAAVAAITIIILFVIPVNLYSSTYEAGLGVKTRNFPDRAIEFIKENRIEGNIFNSFAFGDYLVWKRFPDIKVFIHGRNEVFPEAFYKDYLAMHTSAEAWQRVTDKYNISYALLEYYLTDMSGKEALHHLEGNPDWVPVYWDMVSIVYVKKTAGNEDLIGRSGFRLIRPTYLDFTYLKHYVDRGMTGPLLSELSRLIELSPKNEEALLGRAFVYFNMGSAYYEAARADLVKAIEINPGQAMTHSALGMLLERTGDTKGAEKEYRKTLKSDPGDEAALKGLERVRR